MVSCPILARNSLVIRRKGKAFDGIFGNVFVANFGAFCNEWHVKTCDPGKPSQLSIFALKMSKNKESHLKSCGKPPQPSFDK